MTEYAPGMRTIIRDEEWMIRKVETNTLGNKTLYCVGISPLVKDRESIFLTDLEEIKVVDPADVKLVPDHSSHYKRSLRYRLIRIFMSDGKLRWIRCPTSWILRRWRFRRPGSES